MSRFALRQLPTTSTTFADDVRNGLGASPKSLPPRWFYDALGSALFSAITNLPEYYVTRTEESIVRVNAAEIVEAIGGPVALVELGSGDSRKTRLLIEALLARQGKLEYQPIDIDATVLESTARRLLADFPALTVNAVCAEFADTAAAIRTLPPAARRAVLFLGSTIGNLDEREAVAMLSSLRSALAPGDVLFLGADMVKPRNVLEPAYDDALGVTAAFNLNLLARINRELGGHFRLDRFAHLAFYNEEKSRIEMHLVSREAQTVRIDALDFEIAFAEGETIHTENSHKYTAAQIERIAAATGFTIAKTWTDEQRWFTDALLRAEVE
ncbi:MAG TPA: L-histidine N(alpha)-methyltransferase [Thermoanaerobaculia bacterium]|nr:L-histidine N(alpha)-methyltransferase [Thermoanaerobaculia bacterium]